MAEHSFRARSTLRSLAVFKQFLSNLRAIGKQKSRDKERQSREEPGREATRALAYEIQRAHKYCIKTNIASIQRSLYLLNVRAICTILIHK